MEEDKDKVIKGTIKYRIECGGGPNMSIGGGDDYGTYRYQEWDPQKKRWTEHSGGTDGSTYEPYSSEVTWEDFTPSEIEEYLKEEIGKMGIEVNWKALGPLCRHNLETILEQISKKPGVNNRFELPDGKIAVLEP